jgi:hypothetical protein
MDSAYIGGTETPELLRTLVLYDSSTGVIKHVHQVATMRGGRPRDASAIEADALAIAAARGHQRSRLAVLDVSSQGLDPRTHYRVDVKKRCLTTVPKEELRTAPRPRPTRKARGK